MVISVEVAKARGAALAGGYAYEWSKLPSEPTPRSEGFFAPLLDYFERVKAEHNIERAKILEKLKKYDR